MLECDPDFEAANSGGRWIALEAIASPLSSGRLQDFICRTKAPVPEELIFHISIELVLACRFIQENCTPAIAHGDIHGDNILFDLSRESFPGFPRLVLIDFGHTVRNRFNDCEAVVEELLAWRDTLTSPSHKVCSRTEGWKKFFKYLDSHLQVQSLKTLWDAIGNIALQRREATAQERISEIKELLKNAEKEQEPKLELGFRSAGLL